MHTYIHTHIHTYIHTYTHTYNYISLSIFSDKPVEPVFSQIATQILQKSSSDLRCSQRAWKVTLVGEGADDAGGPYDESIAQMCEVGVAH